MASNRSAQAVSVEKILALADEHRKAGRLKMADRLCRQLLESEPNHPPILHLRALIAHDAGDQGTAITLMRQASAANGRDPLLHCNLAEMFRSAGLLDEALAASRRALALDADFPEALYRLGSILCARGEYKDAVPYLKRAAALAPDNAAAHTNLGHALLALERLPEALDAIEKAIRLNPGSPNGFHNRGVIFQHMGRCEEAEADWKRTLALDPTHIDARISLNSSQGMAFYKMGKLDEAEAHWKQVISLRPEVAEAQTNLAIIHLLRGRLAEGFGLYEWRWRMKNGPPHPELPAPWMGDDPAGKRLLIHAEQGFGDTLQFCRYLPLLRDRGARLAFLVSRPLRPLIAHSMPWLELPHGPQPPSDLQSTLLSLPRLSKTTLGTIPAAIPYIHAPPQAVSRLRDAMGPGPELKVGLAWAGSQKHLLDKERSLAFEALAPILAVKGMRLFSLQIGAAADEVRQARMIDLSPHLTDFAETAGAMGKPVWIMLPFVPDWRWLLEREDSPWYPTARLFRQKTRGDWGQVARDIAHSLTGMAQAEARR